MEIERLHENRKKKLGTLLRNTAKKYLEIYASVDLIEDGTYDGYIDGFLDDIKEEILK